MSVRVSLIVELPKVADMVDWVVAPTAVVVIVNLAEVDPEGMNAYAGTDALGLLDER